MIEDFNILEVVFDAFTRVIGGIFEGGGTLGDVVSGFGRGEVASEGFWSKFMGAVNETANIKFDYDVISGHTSFGGFKSKWGNMSQTSQEEMKSLVEVVTGHGFILQQLEKYRDEPGMLPLYEQYRDLKANLPSEALLKRAYNKLAMFLHPDKKATGSTELFQLLDVAKKSLEMPENRKLYETSLQHNEDTIKELFEKSANMDWASFRKQEVPQARYALTGTVESYTGARKWLNELTTKQKTGLAFAAVGTVALASYGIASVVEHRRQKSAKPNHASAVGNAKNASHKERLQRQEKTQPAQGMATG